MSQVRIRIDNIEADYTETDALPLSFTVQTDSFDQIGSPENSEIDNAAKRLGLPGTLANQRIAEASNGAVQPCQITVDGAPSFEGSARLVQKEREDGELLGFGFRLFSGAKSLFKELGGGTLRGLDLGSISYDLATIEASWSYSAAVSFQRAVFAPVYYGALADAVNNNFTTSDVRPHIFVRRILESIWTRLRVSVDSSLFDSPLFDRLVYLFSVGDQWNAIGNAAEEFDVSTGFSTTITAGGGSIYIDLPNETTDTAAIWNLNFASLNGGTWEFEIDISTITNGNAFLEISGFSDIPLQQQQFNQTFGPISVPSGAIARIRVDQVNPTQPTFISAPIRIRGYQQADPGVGQSIELASCLHDEKITDFLAGLSHMFNLAWHFDPATRILTVDPRFPFVINSIRYDGFYQRLSTGSEDWTGRVDQTSTVEQEGVRPFGNYIDLGYTPEDSYWWRNAKFKGSQEGTPFLGTRFEFSESGEDGVSSQNPFFEDLIMTGPNGTNISYMPAIVPSDDQGVVSDPTYEAGPKLAIFGGDVLGWGSWYWNGSIRASRPILYQQPKTSNDTGQTLCISYADYNTGVGSPNQIRGLTYSFYLPWLVQLERATRLGCDLNLELHDLRSNADLFRRMKIITIRGQRRAFIFEKASNFEPLKAEAAGSVLWEVSPVLFDDLARLLNSSLTPSTTAI